MGDAQKQDDDYQAAVVELDNQPAFYQRASLNRSHPIDSISPERTRWSVVSTALITIMFSCLAVLRSVGMWLQNSAELLLWAAAFGLLGLIVSVILLSPRRMLAVEE